jgi:hypothetical protein
MTFLKLRKSYNKGMFKIKVRKDVFCVSHLVQQFKELGRAMEICVQECIPIVLFKYSYCYVCSVLCSVSLCCSVYCLCVNMYCTTATGCQTQLQLRKYIKNIKNS